MSQISGLTWLLLILDFDFDFYAAAAAAAAATTIEIATSQGLCEGVEMLATSKLKLKLKLKSYLIYGLMAWKLL